MVELQDPSKSHKLIGLMDSMLSWLFNMKEESRKQWEEPESIRVQKGAEESGKVKRMVRESGSERADTLRQT